MKRGGAHGAPPLLVQNTHSLHEILFARMIY
jgi:hypothetical protein